MSTHVIGISKVQDAIEEVKVAVDHLVELCQGEVIEELGDLGLMVISDWNDLDLDDLDSYREPTKRKALLHFEVRCVLP